MKALIRKLLEAFAPWLFDAIRSLRNRRYFHNRFRAFEEDSKSRIFPKNVPIVVLDGPFRGMNYLDETVWGSITPKWLGSYECELHPVLEQILRTPYVTIIDVGCAEGYYAVGLALKKPESRVFAFDTDFISRSQLRRLAKINHAQDRITIKARCSHADLAAIAQGKTLLVCDIEGYEFELLDPASAPILMKLDILVEVHEGKASGHALADALKARFASTHSIEAIEACPRDSWSEACRLHLEKSWLREATEEHREDGRLWFWMRAR